MKYIKLGIAIIIFFSCKKDSCKPFIYSLIKGNFTENSLVLCQDSSFVLVNHTAFSSKKILTGKWNKKANLVTLLDSSDDSVLSFNIDEEKRLISLIVFNLEKENYWLLRQDQVWYYQGIPLSISVDF